MPSSKSVGRPEPRAAAVATAPAILLVELRLDDDGATRSTLRLVQRWCRAGVPTRLIAVQRTGASPAVLPAGVDATELQRPGQRLRRAIVPGLGHLVTLARASDVVVSARELGLGLLLSQVAARLARRPFVVIVRSDPGPAIESYVPPRLQAATLRALRRADRVVCIAPGLVPSVLAVGVERDAVRVVLNGIEVQRVRDDAVRQPLPAPLPAGNGPLVVGVGRLERQKGFDVLLRAHARLVHDGSDARLVLLGEGRERESLERLARELGVSDSVAFPGHAPPLAAVAAADLFCLPSRWEGFGQSLAEALVLGTPCIAADCVAGPRLLLADGAHGDLVPVDDADALADAIERHLVDPGRLTAAASTGQAWALEHLDVDRTAAGILDALREVATCTR